MPINLTRNFCIIAHVDHGKTTLSDRLLEKTGTVTEREKQDQFLDAMDLERERGITIKAHPVTMRYLSEDGQKYRFNLLDTPGHVDFSYEVARSLAACEGALLIIDATQGVEAQTVANVTLAMRKNLTIIPIINKIDLPAADVHAVKIQLEEVLAIPAQEAMEISAKSGIGIPAVLEAIVKRIAPPTSQDTILRGSVFDSVFDGYRGVIGYIRIFSGSIMPGQTVKMMATNKHYTLKEVGIFTPKMVSQQQLQAGDVGYFVASIKSTSDIRVGDTLTDFRRPALAPLSGFQEVRPMVFSGIYPVNTADFESLKIAMSKLQLNDAAFIFQTESSAALGFGFRCGFLGLLHMEIIQERLKREYAMAIVLTYPSVIYEVSKTNGERLEIDNPANLPDMSTIREIREPIVSSFIIVPNENVGDLMRLTLARRGVIKQTESVDDRRIMIRAILPLNEIVVDFHDKIKTLTHGYGSMDYKPAGYFPADLVRLDMLVNGELVEAFSSIVHRDKAESRGRCLAAKLKEVIPNQLYQVAIQAAIGGKIIARENILPLRKNVTAKCYGGDITRKRKLLEKQKEGKKRMKILGKVSIPPEVFTEILKVS